MTSRLMHRTTTRVALVLLGIALAAAAVGCARSIAVPPLSEAPASSPARIPVLAYHGITEGPSVVTDEADPLYFDVRLAEFDRQMADLRDAGYSTITPDDYVKWVAGDDVSLPDKPILITFDDGQTSTRLATPVLERYGFVATMYVVSGFADGSFGGPVGEPGWYLTWAQLQDMEASGTWNMQFHAGPQGHAYVNDAAQPDCHRFYPCRFGQDADTYQARVKADVAQGLGAMRSAFDLPDGWQGSTYAVPWDDPASAPGASSEPDPDPWLGRYFASQFPVVFVQETYTGANNQRYRFELHNPNDLDEFRTGLDSSRFDRPEAAG